MSLNAVFIAGNQVSCCIEEITLRRNESRVSYRELGMCVGGEE